MNQAILLEAFTSLRLALQAWNNLTVSQQQTEFDRHQKRIEFIQDKIEKLFAMGNKDSEAKVNSGLSQ